MEVYDANYQSRQRSLYQVHKKKNNVNGILTTDSTKRARLCGYDRFKYICITTDGSKVVAKAV